MGRSPSIALAVFVVVLVLVVVASLGETLPLFELRYPLAQS